MNIEIKQLKKKIYVHSHQIISHLCFISDSYFTLWVNQNTFYRSVVDYYSQIVMELMLVSYCLDLNESFVDYCGRRAYLIRFLAIDRSIGIDLKNSVKNQQYSMKFTKSLHPLHSTDPLLWTKTYKKSHNNEDPWFKNLW